MAASVGRTEHYGGAVRYRRVRLPGRVADPVPRPDRARRRARARRRGLGRVRAVLGLRRRRRGGVVALRPGGRRRRLARAGARRRPGQRHDPRRRARAGPGTGGGLGRVPHREGQGRPEAARTWRRRSPGSRRSATRSARAARSGSTSTAGGTWTPPWPACPSSTGPPAAWSTWSSPARRCRSSPPCAARWTSPVAADESVRRAADPLAVARAGAADVLVLKVAPLGGVRACLELAEQAGLPVVVSSALETSVGLAAGLALAAALPELPFACGLATGQLLTDDLVAEPPIVVDGAIPVPGPVVPDAAHARRARRRSRPGRPVARADRAGAGAGGRRRRRRDADRRAPGCAGRPGPGPGPGGPRGSRRGARAGVAQRAAGLRRRRGGAARPTTRLATRVRRGCACTCGSTSGPRRSCALGLARAARTRKEPRPVAVVTTSGTAPAHLLPAVLEARHAGLPLLLLTADRPHELRGTGANQTTEQVGLLAPAVRLSVDVPAPVGLPDELRDLRNLAARVVAVALGTRDHTPGPVHVNLAYREPLVPVGPWPEPRRRRAHPGAGPPRNPGGERARSLLRRGDGDRPAGRRAHRGRGRRRRRRRRVGRSRTPTSGPCSPSRRRAPAAAATPSLPTGCSWTSRARRRDPAGRRARPADAVPPGPGAARAAGRRGAGDRAGGPGLAGRRARRADQVVPGVPGQLLRGNLGAGMDWLERWLAAGAAAAGAVAEVLTDSDAGEAASGPLLAGVLASSLGPAGRAGGRGEQPGA